MPNNQVERPISLSIASTFNRPLSIAMVAPCPFPTRQGTQVLIRHLASALAYCGHEVHLITYGHGEYEDDFPFHLHRSPWVGGGLRSGPSVMKPAADAALALTAARVIKAHGCDLMHVHNVEGLGVGAVLKLQTALPLVYHAHNAMGPELPTYFRTALAQSFASVVGEVIDRTFPRAADAVIAFDEDHKALHEVHGIPTERIHVIPPGLLGNELAEPCPEELRRISRHLGEGPWLLYAGNPDGYQNLSLLWESFELIRAERPDVRLLVAANCAEAAFESELRRFQDRSGIVVHRYHSLKELRALFSLASVGLCPRALWTGVPIKLLNYMSVGLPVVACKAAGRHVVGESCGILVEPDAASFAAATLKLLETGAPRARIQRRYRRFRLEGQVGAYESVYRDVLRRKQLN